jgi:hypothetical protein
MKKIIALAFIVLGLNGTAQKNMMFPHFEGMTLDDQRMVIPTKNGKFTIVGMVFKRSAEKELKKWLNPMYNTFMVKGDGKSFDVAAIYDVNFYFVPLISGLKKAKEDFKAGTDKEFWKYIVDSETEIKMMKNNLKITNDEDPYFYVLDKDGKIVEWVSGPFTEAKMDKLEEAVD